MKNYTPHRRVQKTKTVAKGSLVYLVCVFAVLTIGYVSQDATVDPRINKIESVIVKEAPTILHIENFLVKRYPLNRTTFPQTKPTEG